MVLPSLVKYGSIHKLPEKKDLLGDGVYPPQAVSNTKNKSSVFFLVSGILMMTAYATNHLISNVHAGNNPEKNEPFNSHMHSLDHHTTLSEGKEPLSDNVMNGMILDLGASTITAVFPPDVFDEAQMHDTAYMQLLNNRCTDKLNKSKISQVLACSIYFSQAAASARGSVPLVFGTFKLDTNLLNPKMSTSGAVDTEAFTPIFEGDIMAVLINNHCLVWDPTDAAQTTTTTQFHDSESYSKMLSKENSFSLDVSAGYGPVTANAGYSKVSEKKTKNTSFNAYAFGKKEYSAKIGTLTNTCFGNSDTFDSIKHMIKPTVVDQWNAIRKTTDKNALLKLKEFKSVAMNGLILPSMYNYGISVSYTMTSKYTQISSSSSKTISTAIKAGIEVNTGEASGGVQSAVKKAMNDAVTANDVVFTVDTTLQAIGSDDVNTGCVENNTCPLDIQNGVKKIRRDLTHLGQATGFGALKSLNDIVKMYYKDDGFGLSFEKAIVEYLTMYKCVVPNSECLLEDDALKYNEYNGEGKLMPKEHHCNFGFSCKHSVVFKNSETDTQVCTATKMYKCMKPDLQWYIPGGNSIEVRTGDKPEKGSYCDAGQTCEKNFATSCQPDKTNICTTPKKYSAWVIDKLGMGCDCDHRGGFGGSCVISAGNDSKYVMCECHNTGAQSCTGRALPCKNVNDYYCLHPDRSYNACLYGGGDCYEF